MASGGVSALRALWSSGGSGSSSSGGLRGLAQIRCRDSVTPAISDAACHVLRTAVAGGRTLTQLHSDAEWSLLHLAAQWGDARMLGLALQLSDAMAATDELDRSAASGRDDKHAKQWLGLTALEVAELQGRVHCA